MRGLHFLGSKGTLASYHNPRSLTWRWLIHYQWRFPEVWRKPSKWVMASRFVKPNGGGDMCLCFGPLAISYVWQQPMWLDELRAQ